VQCPPNGRWVAIRFRLGVYLPHLPTRLLLDHRDVNLPVGADGSFWLGGCRCELPDFRERRGAGGATGQKRGHRARTRRSKASCRATARRSRARSVQRHFQHATGMSHGRFRQIERARHAANLLRAGTPILEAVHEAGYFVPAAPQPRAPGPDRPDPRRIQRQEAQLSFLYKTSPEGGG